MVKIVLCGIVIVLTSACSSFKYLNNNVPDFIKSNFTLCFENRETGIDSVININGYYKQTPCNQIERNKEGTTASSFSFTMVFLSNGIFARQCGNFQTTDSLESFTLNAYEWGLYKVFGDTIVVQYVNHSSGMATWNAWEGKYIILNKNTLKQIDINPIHYVSESYQRILRGKWKSKFSTAKFTSLSSKPIPNCWLEKEEWFKCE